MPKDHRASSREATARTAPRKRFMKTYCKALDIDESFVRAAYAAWERSEAGHKNRWRVFEEYGTPSALVSEIAREIRDRSVSVKPIRRYRYVEPTNGKTRIIGIESVKQQVIDYVAVKALEPLLDAKAGYYQVSSVKGKGQLFAARTVRRWVQQGGYWVHLDIRKCYPSISHDVVMKIICKYVRSDEVRYLCERLLATYDQGGLEIGSYFSLRMAQLVLSFGYHHVESLCKERRGQRTALVSHQIWYMDDVVLMSPDKRNLKMAARALSRYLRDAMGLDVKSWKVCPVSDGEPIDIAGFVVRKDRTTIRASIFLRARRALRAFSRKRTVSRARRACSYWGWFKHTDSAGFIERNEVAAIQGAASLIVSRHDRRKARKHGQDLFRNAARGCTC